MPSLSIVMPNRNHAIELETSLGAIVAQTRLPDEIVIVDDASTDHSRDVIKAFQARCPAIRMIENKERLGVAGAVNRGLREATGEWLVLASADERLEPAMCGDLLASVTSHPGARLAISSYCEWHPDTATLEVHDSGSELGMWYVEDSEPQFVSPERLHALLAERFVWIGANTAIMRREDLLSVGGFDAALRWHGDWFAMYAIAFEHGFLAVPRPYAWFRVDPHSYSGRGMRDPVAREEVALAIQAKLAEPRFSGMRNALRRSPGAMSPFFRPTLTAMARRPRLYREMAPMLGWWLGEVMRGRRPGSLAKLVGRRTAGTRQTITHLVAPEPAVEGATIAQRRAV